jgi:hypothetical protein
MVQLLFLGILPLSVILIAFIVFILLKWYARYKKS